MNSVKTWIMPILILLVISVLLWSWLNVSFVTHPIENVEKVVIVIEPYQGGEKREINIINKLEIERIYGMLKETTMIHINRYPGHLSSLQFDPEFDIRIEYRNGKTDKYSAISSDAIFRRLNTATSHGDVGYIRGSNEELWRTVETYIFK